ncbi:MAG TPA: EAL domain-containing protein [Streptosporangiaceae bacterium]|nr:EAL domain-containing protein [Streptosporangiaceae bacterium]
MPRATRAIITASILGGAFTLYAAAAAWPLTAVDPSQWVVAGTVGALALGSWLWPVVVYRGEESETFQLDEGFFVVLALLDPPLLMFATLALATILAQAIRRRPLLKSAFNVGQVLIAAGLGLVASRAVAPLSVSLRPVQIAAIAVGVAVYFVVNTLLVNSAMVSMGTSWREFTADLPVQIRFAGTAALMGVVLALAARAHLWALALAAPGLVLVRQLIAARYSALHDRSRIKDLYEVTKEANSRLRERAVLDTILTSVRTLLRSPDAQLADADPGGHLTAAMTVGGEQRWLVVAGRRRDEPVSDAECDLLHALAAVGDGALRNAELYQQVRLEREKLSSIALNIGEGVCAVDAAGRLTFLNPAAADLTGLPPVPVSAAGEADREDPPPAPDYLLGPAREAMRSGRTIREDDARFRAGDGATIPVAYTASAVISDGMPSGAVIAFRDITERKAFEDELHQHAFYDSLTGLANRRLLVERLDQALRQSEKNRKAHALIFVDVDRFKGINDSLGHVTGDEFLVAIGTRLKGVVRSRDLVARIGGDEFVVLLEDVAGPDEAEAATARICGAAERPMLLSGGHELVASVSAGLALTAPGQSADDVLRDADVAMYEAKTRGGGIYRVFNQVSMGIRSSERLQIEADLRKGLERDELEVHYQPFYSLDGREIVGAEALVRWRHPATGVLHPMKFIPMAEETGLILPLGRFVLDRASRQARSIRDRLGVDLPISINLSSRQFQDKDLLSHVTMALDASELPPELLTFEITESMVMADLAGAREVMKRLNRLGVRLSIDDFGTGHSSLAYLKQFPVHEVKVDRSFVEDIAQNPVDSAIVQAILDLANAIGLAAVAEGVETAEQIDELKMLGCQIGQGTFFSPPLCTKEFDELLTMFFAKTPEAAQVRAGQRSIALNIRP